MARILCIDDEPAALRLRVQILSNAGHTVSAATTGREALSKFRSGEFDLVVSDHVLGRDTGTQLAIELRRLRPEVPILILSGTSEIPEHIENADGFLSKLEGPKVFLKAVEDMLARFKSANAASRGEISELFARELGTAPTQNPEDLTMVARRVLRQKYITADIGLTGANFAIAETGTIVLVGPGCPLLKAAMLRSL